MSCNRSLWIHLLRGVGALALIASAFFTHVLGTPGAVLAILGAAVLMRGCPMCWLMGLLETLTKPWQKQLPNK